MNTFQLEWVDPLRPCGPSDVAKARLIGRVRILGTDFHVNAEEVRAAPSGELDEPASGRIADQVSAIGQSDTYVCEIQNLIDGPGRTVMIEGREYLLVISPFKMAGYP